LAPTSNCSRNAGDSLKGKLLLAIAILVIVGSVISILRQQTVPQDKHTPLFRGLGEATAEQALKLSTNRGQTVLWLLQNPYESPSTPQPKRKAFLDGLTDTLGKVPGAKLVATENIVQTRSDTGGAPDVTKEQLIGLLQKYAQADVIILYFLQVPRLTGEELRALGEPRPKLLQLDLMPYDPQQTDRYDSQLIKAVIAARAVQTNTQQAAKTPRQQFDRDFQVVVFE
jgi:hypothetical protein